MLSKSEYMMFLKHPGLLWVKKYRKDLLPVVDDNLQAIFQQGNEFEAYAESLFPNVKRLGFQGYNSYLQLPEKTEAAWRSGANCVAQGRYEFQELTCITDLLEKLPENGYKLVEIKSSTKAKEEHYLDLAFQWVVLEGAGYDILNCELALVNSEFVREGAVDPKEFVKFVDVTAAVKAKLEDTKTNISEALSVIKQKEMPPINPEFAKLNSYAEWMEIRKKLLPSVPDGSIYKLPSINAEQVYNLLKKGITSENEVPEGAKLYPSTKKYLRAKKIGHQEVDVGRLRQFMDRLTYPLYFFDYETSQNLIPKWDGTKPYQQVTFQYSLHVLDEPGGNLRHLEYLHQNQGNPAPELLEKLKMHMGNSGSVLSWYAKFERMRNNELSAMYPEYKELLEGINSRLIDLMDPFAEEMVVDPDFNGSASIKSVLPVFCPKLGYNDLEIKEGQSAARLWKKATFELQDEHEKNRIYANLIKYCERDTYAMVAIYEKLREYVSADDKPA